MKALIEIPLARVIAREIGREEAPSVIREIARGNPEAIGRAEEAIGTRIEIYDGQHPIEIQCVYELCPPTARDDHGHEDDGVYFDNKGVVMRGAALPDTGACAIVGRPIEEILDHPLLRGLIVTDATSDEDAIVVETEDCMIDVNDVERVLEEA